MDIPNVASMAKDLSDDELRKAYERIHPPAKWKWKDVNQGHIRHLKEKFGRKHFTTQQAVNVYMTLHAEDPHNWYWGGMNARNSISAATKFGLLRRVRKGVYAIGKETAWQRIKKPSLG